MENIRLRYFNEKENSYKSQVHYGNNSANAKIIESQGSKIYYEVNGNGKPIVILHGGIVGSIGEMGGLIDNLSSSNKIIAIATRGHGKSEIGTVEETYEVKAIDVKNVIENETNEKVKIIGFSDGAYTGLFLSAMFPDKVEKLIAIGAGTWKAKSKQFPAFEIFRSLDTKYWDEQMLIRPEPDRINQWYDSITTYYANLEVGEKIFGKVESPTLLMAGDKDQNAPLQTVVEAYKMMKNAQLSIIPDSGHEVVSQRFQEIWLIIKKFL